ncbi:MAG: hypothetical protein KKA79_01595 [Nanoarchaeota archaeon]|nr:hypothetical protein [Nanoarchaeota archaeon]
MVNKKEKETGERAVIALWTGDLLNGEVRKFPAVLVEKDGQQLAEVDTPEGKRLVKPLYVKKVNGKNIGLAIG